MSPHEQLLQIIRDVRARWRWKVAVRSLAVTAGAGVATVLVAAVGLEQFRFSPSSVVVARLATYAVFAATGWFFLIRPLSRRVSDQQVALYLEEHEPSLQQLLVSAVAAGHDGGAGRDAGESAALLARLVESAIERCQASAIGRSLERRSLRQSAVALAVLAAVSGLVFFAGPAYLRQGALAVLVPVGGAEAASPYRIVVKPGNTTVSRGADVALTATLHGFTSADADLFTRSGRDAPFERVPMVAVPGPGGSAAGAAAGAPPPAFDVTLFALRETTEYFVQAAGVRSPIFTLTAADLPYAERLRLEYRFPPYTALEPAIVEAGGDIAVLRGTTVHATVFPTMPVREGRLVRDGTHAVALAANPDGTWSGSFDVRESGIYRVELATAPGTFVAASPQYTIDVLADQPPVVSLPRPARDVRATAIDEVYVEAAADDDFGVAQVDLVFAVNGGPERPVRLATPRGAPQKGVTAGHTFFLEDLGLQPGDVVSYFARAADADAVSGAKTATSDIFFLQIQPFRKDYRAAESQAGGEPAGGGNQGGSDPSALSEQQRRIVSGTFNLVRDRDRSGDGKFRQDAAFLALVQGQLKERARGLSAQILQRVAGADPVMTTIASRLADAAAAMAVAETKLQAQDAKAALPPGQQALAHLQRAEEAYRDVRVRMAQQGGGGGGGGQGSSAAADELADLFQLEMDKLRNQYETFQRSRQEGTENAVDEMLERLKELARRQEQEAERQRQLRGSRQAGGSGAAARQRALAEETEAAARQLERLSREEGRQDLAQTARGLREAADAMRRAAAGGDAGAVTEAREAAERLGAARDRLDRERADAMARAVASALARVRDLARTQEDVAGEVRGLGAPGPSRREQLQRIFERKDAQVDSVTALERQLDGTAADFRRERQQAARRLQEAADAIRDRRLKDKIRYSKGVAQGAAPEAAAEFEAQIGSDIAAIEAALREASATAAAPARDTRAEALARAGALVRGVESMQRRGGAGADAPQGVGDPRQFRREARERRGDAEVLRRDLQAMGLDTGELDALIGRMQALEGDRVFDSDEAARLQAQLVDGVRRFEFELRRRLGAATADQLLLAGPDGAPAVYRKAVEEYYRSLAREKKR
jgi:hypothetical protein